MRAPCMAVWQGLEPRVEAQAGRPSARIEHDLGRVHPSRIVGQVAGIEGAGHRPSQQPLPEQSEARQPKEAGLGLLLPGGSLASPPPPLTCASDFTLGTSGAASGGLMETLSATALHVRGG